MPKKKKNYMSIFVIKVGEYAFNRIFVEESKHNLEKMNKKEKKAYIESFYGVEFTDDNEEYWDMFGEFLIKKDFKTVELSDKEYEKMYNLFRDQVV